MPKYLAPISLLLMLVVATGLQVHNFEALTFDDELYVFNNPNVLAGISPDTLRWAFSNTESNLWHPLTWISHQLDIDLFGPNPGKHHLVNLLLHAANSLLVFLLLEKVTREKWMSFLVAGLFATHPHMAEVVGWISERKELLAAFFGISSLLIWAHYTERKNNPLYILSLLCMLLACLSKPSMVVLPGGIVLFGWLRSLSQSETFPLKERLFQLAPFFAFSLGIASIAIIAQDSGEIGALSELQPLEDRIAFLPSVLFYYLSSGFYPVNLTLFNLTSATPPSIWWNLPTWTGVSIFLYALYRNQQHVALMGFLWFLLFLLPVMGFIPVSEHYVATRYAYIPQIGLYLLFGSTALALIKKILPAQKTAISFCLSTPLLLGCAYLGHTQLKLWQNGITLFSREVALNPHDQKAWIQLGLSQAKAEQTEASIHSFQTATQLPGNLYTPFTNLGIQLFKQGQQHLAKEALLQATQAPKIDSSIAHRMLAGIYAKQKDYQKAAHTLESGLAHHPSDTESIVDLAAIKGLILKQPQEAIQLIEKALALSPGHIRARATLVKIQTRAQAQL